MSYACPTIDRGNPFAVPTNNGVSDDAETLNKLLEGIRDDYSRTVTMTMRDEQVINALEETLEECSVYDWDGYGAQPVELESVMQAKRFLDTLPITFPFPEISVDPDGEITLEWYAGPRKVFYLSIGGNSQLTYAGLFGPSDSRRGTKPFGDELPKTILKHIKRVFA